VAGDSSSDDPPPVRAVPLIARTHAEMLDVLARLRESRAALERAAAAGKAGAAALVLEEMEGRLATVTARLEQLGVDPR
jgi:hypothetical protein